MAEASKIEKEKKVIVYCRSGKRSANAIQILEDQHSMVNLYNLEGGILACHRLACIHYRTTPTY